LLSTDDRCLVSKLGVQCDMVDSVLTASRGPSALADIFVELYDRIYKQIDKQSNRQTCATPDGTSNTAYTDTVPTLHQDKTNLSIRFSRSLICVR